MGRLGECLRLTRPVNSLMVGFAVIVGLVIVMGGGILELGPRILVASYMTGALVAASSMVLNDIVDVEIDRANKRLRPLVKGTVSVKEAWACYVILSLGGMATAATLGLQAFAVAVAGWLIGSIYDVWGKRSGLPGNFMVAFSTSLPFPFAMAVAGEWSETVTVYWAIVFLAVLAREIVKDIADVEGDRLGGARTLPLVAGIRAASILAAFLYLAAVFLSPLPLLWETVNPYTYAPPILLVDIILAYEALRLLRGITPEQALEHKKRALLAMLLGLIGFLLGSIL